MFTYEPGSVIKHIQFAFSDYLFSKHLLYSPSWKEKKEELVTFTFGESSDLEAT